MSYVTVFTKLSPNEQFSKTLNICYLAIKSRGHIDSGNLTLLTLQEAASGMHPEWL